MTRVQKRLAILAATGAAMTMATSASAEVYQYQTNISNGIGDVQVTIDTVAQTATFTGPNINMVMTDATLANWNPNLSSRGIYMQVDNLTGTFTRYGKTYDAFFSTSPKHTSFRLGDDYAFLWMYGRDANGRVLDFDGKGTSTTYTGSTGGGSSTSTGGSTSSTSGGSTTGGSTTGGSTTGGSTTGGSTTGGSTTGGSTTGGSTGGTPIPAPGMLGLFGLALAAIGLGRRRRNGAG